MLGHPIMKDFIRHTTRLNRNGSNWIVGGWDRIGSRRIGSNQRDPVESKRIKSDWIKSKSDQNGVGGWDPIELKRIGLDRIKARS